MSVSITTAAADHVKACLTTRKRGLGVRLGVRTTGCSGMAYALEFADSRGDEDEVFESQGISLFVSKKDMTYLSGLTLDFQKQGLNEGFAFLNPNETGRCGCGESFNV